MRVREVYELTPEQYADSVLIQHGGTFQSKELRDAVAKLLKSYGFTVRRGSISNQNLHPEYVTDYVGTLETGFGNI